MLVSRFVQGTSKYIPLGLHFGIKSKYSDDELDYIFEHSHEIKFVRKNDMGKLNHN